MSLRPPDQKKQSSAQPQTDEARSNGRDHTLRVITRDGESLGLIDIHDSQTV